MQMSAVQLFVFVEGSRGDPNFYGSICSAVPEAASMYEIELASRLSGASGGKEVLLSFFAYLRSRRQLIGVFKGKKTAAIFFLDKDLDDIRRTRKRSPHIVYTEFYEVENHIFEHSDLVRGAAAAASADPRVLSVELGGAHSWCRRSAHLWRDWTVLCLCALTAGIACEAKYAVQSRVQTRPCGPTDPTKHQQLVDDILRRAGVPAPVLQAQLSDASERVDRYFGNGDHHRVFKGTWFSHILADQIDLVLKGVGYQKAGLSTRLPGALAATLDYNQSWADHFKDPVRTIAALLQP